MDRIVYIKENMNKVLDYKEAIIKDNKEQIGAEYERKGNGRKSV